MFHNDIIWILPPIFALKHVEILKASKYWKLGLKSSFWLKFLIKNTLHMFLKCPGDISGPGPPYKIFGQKIVYLNGANVLISCGVNTKNVCLVNFLICSSLIFYHILWTFRFKRDKSYPQAFATCIKKRSLMLAWRCQTTEVWFNGQNKVFWCLSNSASLAKIESFCWVLFLRFSINL